MLPALAARIITEYTCAGELVVDPYCTTGATLLGAATHGRRAIGVEADDRRGARSLALLEDVLTPEQCLTVEVRTGDPRRLTSVLRDAVGLVDLVLLSPPPGHSPAAVDQPGRAARGAADLTTTADVLAGCYQVLRPGGLLATVTHNTRRGGRTSDLAGATVALARAAGFGYLQHVIALRAAVRDSALTAPPSAAALTRHRRAAGRGQPAHLVVHDDICVFRKPTAAETGVGR